MASTQTDNDIKERIEATVKSYLTCFIDARAKNDTSLVNRNTAPECTRQMLPSPLGGGATMSNDVYEKVFAQGLKLGGMHEHNATDLVVDVGRRKAAATTIANLVFVNGDKVDMEFVWFLNLNDDGSKITKIVEFVDSDTFQKVKAKMEGMAKEGVKEE
ncbi:hypothetical protein FSARC_7298 [Fusarium sarcochroum]|uniref:SnoaL-like domain-containing protein n=1 Tax=Fusarium sarcochroum TaxID=1208366 RepID=A0A8H4TVC3_9HYPO|nr:hypothetical protein FSARC_7298 [Fusarium sarcochroum]